MITAASDSYWFDLWTATSENFGSSYDAYGQYFDGHYDWNIDLTEGETVWFRINSNEDTDLSYRVVVRNKDQAFNTNLLTGLTWQNASTVDTSVADYTSISNASDTGFTLTVNTGSEDSWNTQALIAELPVFNGYYYKLTFNLDAQTSSGNQPQVMLQENHQPYNDASEFYDIDTNVETHEYAFTGAGDYGLSKLLFDRFGAGTYTFSNIELVRVTDAEYQLWVDEQEAAQYPYNHETYKGTVTSDDPVWYEYTVENGSLLDVYELINIYGDVTVEVYDADKENLYSEVYDQVDRRRVYFEDDMTIWFKVSTTNDSEDYKFHFAKFDREDTVTIEGDAVGTIEPYSVDNYQFTAPKAGNYIFSLNTDGQLNMELYLNDLATGYLPSQNEDNADQNGFSGYGQSYYETSMNLNAGDTVYIKLTDNQYDEPNDYTLSVLNSEENIEDGSTD